MLSFWEFAEIVNHEAEIKNFLFQNLQLDEYGETWTLYKASIAVPAEDAKKIIIDAILRSPQFKEYSTLITRTKDPFGTDPYVYFRDPALIFEHLNYSLRLQLKDAYADRVHFGPQTIQRQQARRAEYDKKIKNTQETKAELYLLHANQCGYLLKNTSLLFERSPAMWAVSVRTIIKGININKLTDFIDATGQQTLSEIASGREGESSLFDIRGGIEARYKAFAEKILEFLNLEFILSIDELSAPYLASGGNSGVQSIEQLGGTRDVVLDRLSRMKPANVEEEFVKMYFDEGYAGKLRDTI